MCTPWRDSVYVATPLSEIEKLRIQYDKKNHRNGRRDGKKEKYLSTSNLHCTTKRTDH